jgi:hypothetical protein
MHFLVAPSLYRHLDTKFNCVPRVFADYAIYVRLPSRQADYVNDCVSDFVIAKLMRAWGDPVKTQIPTNAPS